MLKVEVGMFTTLNPSDSVVDWVIEQLPVMGAGWCPPGVLGVGIGAGPEQAPYLLKSPYSHLLT